jgi:hypothetical protein
MSFLPSLASVFGARIAWIALAGLAIGATAAAGDPIPGPPLASASDRAAFCPLPSTAAGSAVGFAFGVLLTAIAARGRGKEADEVGRRAASRRRA